MYMYDSVDIYCNTLVMDDEEENARYLSTFVSEEAKTRL